MESNKNYIVEDEDGVVLYDETDDQDLDVEENSVEKGQTASLRQGENKLSPAEEEGFVLTDVEEIPMRGIVKDKDGYRLRTNEEIFTDEYMQEYDRYNTETKEKKKGIYNISSVCVIIFCIGTIIFFFWLFS